MCTHNQPCQAGIGKQLTRHRQSLSSQITQHTHTHMRAPAHTYTHMHAHADAQGLSEANVILLRGCGCRIKVPGFKERHGMQGVLVAPTKIIAGVLLGCCALPLCSVSTWGWGGEG